MNGHQLKLFLRDLTIALVAVAAGVSLRNSDYWNFTIYFILAFFLIFNKD